MIKPIHVYVAKPGKDSQISVLCFHIQSKFLKIKLQNTCSFNTVSYKKLTKHGLKIQSLEIWNCIIFGIEILVLST